MNVFKYFKYIFDIYYFNDENILGTGDILMTENENCNVLYKFGSICSSSKLDSKPAVVVQWRLREINC